MRKIEEIIDQYFDFSICSRELAERIRGRLGARAEWSFSWDDLTHEEKKIMLIEKLKNIIEREKKIKTIEITEENLINSDLFYKTKKEFINRRYSEEKDKLLQEEPYKSFKLMRHMIHNSFINESMGHPDDENTIKYLNSVKKNSGLYFSNEFEYFMMDVGIIYDLEKDKDLDKVPYKYLNNLGEDDREVFIDRYQLDKYQYKILDECFDFEELDFEEIFHKKEKEYNSYEPCDIISRFAHGEMGSYFGFGDKSTGIAQHKEQLAKIEQFFKQHAEILPEFFITYANIYNFLDENKVLFSWKKHRPHEESEVLMLNLTDRTISRVSNSLANLLARGLRCMKIRKHQDIFNPEDKVLKIIQEVDGDNVLPSSSAVFKLDDFAHLPDFEGKQSMGRLSKASDNQAAPANKTKKDLSTYLSIAAIDFSLNVNKEELTSLKKIMDVYIDLTHKSEKILDQLYQNIKKESEDRGYKPAFIEKKYQSMVKDVWPLFFIKKCQFKGISEDGRHHPEKVMAYFESLKKKSKMYFSNEFEELISIIGIDCNPKKGIENQFASGESGLYLGFYEDSSGILYTREQEKQSREFLKSMQDIYPPFFSKYAYIYNWFGLPGEVLFSWKKHQPHEQSEVLLLLTDGSIARVSNSLSNLLLRGLLCIQAGSGGIYQDIFDPEDEVLKIIQEVDGDNVLPNPSAIFKFDELENFPDEWKTMLSKKDA